MPTAQRMRLFLFLGLVVLSPPLTVALVELVTAFLTVESYWGAWSWSTGLVFLVTGGGVVAIVAGLQQRLIAHPSRGRVNALTAALLWGGLIHHAIFAAVFHMGVLPALDSDGFLLALVCASAVGLYFATLAVIGLIGDWELQVPFGKDGSVVGRINGKLFLGVFLTVFCYLAGAVGVALMPVHAAHDPPLIALGSHAQSLSRQ